MKFMNTGGLSSGNEFGITCSEVEGEAMLRESVHMNQFKGSLGMDTRDALKLTWKEV